MSCSSLPLLSSQFQESDERYLSIFGSIAGQLSPQANWNLHRISKRARVDLSSYTQWYWPIFQLLGQLLWIMAAGSLHRWSNCRVACWSTLPNHAASKYQPHCPLCCLFWAVRSYLLARRLKAPESSIGASELATSLPRWEAVPYWVGSGCHFKVERLFVCLTGTGSCWEGCGSEHRRGLAWADC